MKVLTNDGREATLKLGPTYLGLAGVLFMTSFVLLTAGCGSAPEPRALGVDDSGATVTLEPQQELVISLEGNPTTGFSWAGGDIDEAVLAPVGEPEYTPTSTGSTLVGGGGTYTLRFQAVAAGETMLRLVYARSWESGVDPEGTFSVTVAVK